MIRGLGNRLVLIIFAALVLLGVAGCHHPAERYPEAHPEAWTPTDVETMLGGDDPCEPWNRSMFACTDFLMDYVADPVGRVYTSIFPRPFVEHFNNVCVNLEYPARLFSSLLRAEWGAAGDETLRFLLNTTVGIVGIFDVAQSWFHIPSSEADFGSTFAHWGIGSGHTFMLPIVPALNGRDMLGMFFDSAFDIKTYIPYAGYATFLNRMVIAHSAYSSVTDDALDPYKSFRQMMLLRKELQIKMWFYRYIKQQIAMYKNSKAGENPLPAPAVSPEVRRPKPDGIKANWHELAFFNSRNPVTDSLRVMMFQPQTDYDKWYMPRSLFDSSFNGKRSVYKLELVPGRPRARYSYYERNTDKKKPAVRREELVLILPGIGGSINTASAVAFAEIFHRKDCKVAVFDSTFNWNFIVADSKGKLPGFLPDDAERVRTLLKSALSDMRKRKLIPENCRITLAGYSLGGLHTLKIAELETKKAELGIDQFIAVNPPVSLRHAMARIDELAGTSANWSKTQLLKKLHDACGKAFILFTKRYQTFAGDKENKNYRIDIGDDVARIFAGFYLRLALRDVLLASHREKPLPGLPAYSWGRRHKLYEAIDRVTMQEYAEKFLQRDYPGRSVNELLARSELKDFADAIKNHPGVKIIHNYDDFLLNDDERRYLDEAFASKLTWFSHGGHLGNLYYLPVQAFLLTPFFTDAEKK
ncbi:MAG: VacJ family lipoprotein [Lentisphaerae bacterium]|nr:VacJ family lipoprotein [Lentisphaerota bacterium]